MISCFDPELALHCMQLLSVRILEEPSEEIVEDWDVLGCG